MKRLHVHIQTDDLEKSIAYYTALFGAPPEKRKDDYARWLLDDPLAHVSVSAHGGKPGIDHLGVSIGTAEELEAYADRLASADAAATPEISAECCYARSDKHWSEGPNGELWELFHTYAESDQYGDDRPGRASPTACCG